MNNTQAKSLISMQNGDVYTVAMTAGAILGDLLTDGEAPLFIQLFDTKGNKTVWVNTAQISSVVVLEAGDGQR